MWVFVRAPRVVVRARPGSAAARGAVLFVPASDGKVSRLRTSLLLVRSGKRARPRSLRLSENGDAALSVPRGASVPSLLGEWQSASALDAVHCKPFPQHAGRDWMPGQSDILGWSADRWFPTLHQLNPACRRSIDSHC